jgi:hypothetical protein
VVQPHTCISNKGKENHHHLTARYLARRILGLIDNNNDISVSSLQESISRFIKYDVVAEPPGLARFRRYLSTTRH